MIFWIPWEKVRVGWFENIALKHVYYHMWNRSSVQVQYMRQGAQGWCTGMTQKDGMRREMGGVFRMGNTCQPWLIHVNVWQKPLQYCKLINLQLNKFKKKSMNQNKQINKVSDQKIWHIWRYLPGGKVLEVGNS